jgi:hypothetical protein
MGYSPNRAYRPGQLVLVTWTGHPHPASPCLARVAGPDPQTWIAYPGRIYKVRILCPVHGVYLRPSDEARGFWTGYMGTLDDPPLPYYAATRAAWP